MKKINVCRGKCYSVLSAEDCEITLEGGQVIVAVYADVQGFFVAPADGEVYCSAGAAKVTECRFNSAPVSQAASGGSNNNVLNHATITVTDGTVALQLDPTQIQTYKVSDAIEDFAISSIAIDGYKVADGTASTIATAEFGLHLPTGTSVTWPTSLYWCNGTSVDGAAPELASQMIHRFAVRQEESQRVIINLVCSFEP